MQLDSTWGLPLVHPISKYNEWLKTLGRPPAFIEIFEGLGIKIYYYTITNSGKTVAYIVKELEDVLPGEAGEGEFHDKFYFCKHIVRKYDQKYLPEQRKKYLIMEYVSGGSLPKYMSDHKKSTMSSGEVWVLALNMLQALSCIHSQQVYHRDIKPNNICYDPETKRFKLIDFGNSKSGNDSTSFRAGLDQYEAPEIRDKSFPTEQIDLGKADLFSLGLTLVAVVAGITKFNVLCQKITKLVEDSSWKKPNQSLQLEDLIINFKTETEYQLLKVVSMLLELTPNKRPTAAALLKQTQGEMCLEMHQQPLVKPKPPHQQQQGSESGKAQVEGLLSKFCEHLVYKIPYTPSTAGSSCRSSSSLEEDNSKGDSRPDFVNVASELIDRGVKLRAALADTFDLPQKLTLWEPMSSSKFQPSWQPVFIKAFSGTFSPDNYALPTAHHWSEEHDLAGFILATQVNPALNPIPLTGFGMVAIKELKAIYLGQFKDGVPDGYGRLIRDSAQDAESVAWLPTVHQETAFLEYIFSEDIGSVLDSRTQCSSYPDWSQLFKFQDRILFSYSGEFYKGKPKTLTYCQLEYDDKLQVRLRVLDWTVTGSCFIKLGEKSIMNGHFSAGKLDKNSKLSMQCFQPVNMSSSSSFKETKSIYESSGPSKGITLLTEEGWLYHSQKWKSYHAAEGSITLAGDAGLDFKYEGSWDHHKMNDDSGHATLEAKLLAKSAGATLLLGSVNQQSFGGYFSGRWLSWENLPGPGNLQKTVIEVVEENWSYKKKSSINSVEIKYKGSFKDNLFTGNGKLTVETGLFTAQYIGTFELGCFSGQKDCRFEISTTGAMPIKFKYEGGFSEGKFNGEGRILCSEGKEPKITVVKLNGTFQNGKLVDGTRFKCESSVGTDVQNTFDGFVQKSETVDANFQVLSNGELKYRNGTVYNGDLVLNAGKLEIFNQFQELESIIPLTRDKCSILRGIRWQDWPYILRNFRLFQFERHGRGICNRNTLEDTDTSFDRYEGDWKNNKIAGIGHLRRGEDVYMGFLKPHAIYHGKDGVLVRSQAKRYEGEFIDGVLPTGKLDEERAGISYTYTGQFNKRFEMDGIGTVNLNSRGQVITNAVCKAGQITSGEWIFENGAQYHGGFQRLQFHGQKSKVFTALYDFTGDFFEGVAQGFGALTIKDNPNWNHPEEIKIYEGNINQHQTFGANASIRFWSGDTFQGRVSAFELETQTQRDRINSMVQFRQVLGVAGDLISSLQNLEKVEPDTSNLTQDSIPESIRIYAPKRSQLNGEGVFTSVSSGKVYKSKLKQGYPEDKQGICEGVLFNRKYRYEGELVKGKMQGKGILRFLDKPDIFESDCWQDDHPVKGMMQFATTNERYEGEFKGFSRHGKGKFTYAKNQTSGFKCYQGEFGNNQLQGYGEMQFIDGIIFRGHFDQGKQRGPGVKICKPVSIQKSEGFKSFMMGGRTQMFRYTNKDRGDLYEGEFTDGRLELATVYLDCKAIDETKDEFSEAQGYYAIYKGQIDPLNYELTAKKAKITYTNDKMEYEGEVKASKRHGKGVLKFDSQFKNPLLRGCQIQATFKENSIKGECELKYSDSDRRMSYTGNVCDKYLPKGSGQLLYKIAGGPAGEEMYRIWKGKFVEGKPSGDGDCWEGNDKPRRMAGNWLCLIVSAPNPWATPSKKSPVKS